MPIVLGNDTGVSAASSSFNHYLLVILWSWQFLVIIISDFGYLVTLLMSIVLIWGALFWFALSPFRFPSPSIHFSPTRLSLSTNK